SACFLSGLSSFPIGPTTKHNGSFGASVVLLMVAAPLTCLGPGFSPVPRSLTICPKARTSLTAAPVSGFRRRSIHVRRRQGFTNRLRPEFCEDAPQRADARRERARSFLTISCSFFDRDRDT